MHSFETVHAEPWTSIETPRYRVNFWQRKSEKYAWSLDAYVLEGAESICETLRWVGEHSNGRRVEVFVETEEKPEGSFTDPRKCGLIRLLGENPNVGLTVEIDLFKRI